MSDADTSEHVVITYMTTGDAPSGDALNTYNDMMEKLNAILTEKVNAELETYFISWTDYLANYNLTLAQMDGSVDLVGTSSDWLAERQERRVSGAVRGDAADLRAADLGKRAGRSLGTVQVRR
jgi:ABC-type glycerol-3-phosphate transport system substrate-binding protein